VSAPYETITKVTISGSATPASTVAEEYTVSFTGDASDATYLWTTTDGSAVISASTAATTDITFSAAGDYVVTCVVSSANAGGNSVGDNLDVTAS